MRDWIRFAACRGNWDIMFDETQIRTALAMCENCPVFDSCLVDAAEYLHDLTAGVVAGINRWETRGRNKRAIRYCLHCDRPMYVEDRSTQRWCSESCARAPSPKEDLAELRGHLEELIARA